MYILQALRVSSVTSGSQSECGDWIFSQAEYPPGWRPDFQSLHSQLPPLTARRPRSPSPRRQCHVCKASLRTATFHTTEESGQLRDAFPPGPPTRALLPPPSLSPLSFPPLFPLFPLFPPLPSTLPPSSLPLRSYRGESCLGD